jgi:DNA-binding NarL/FixJ family response regulator
MPYETLSGAIEAKLYDRALDLIEASPEVELVGYAVDGQEAHELARALRPDFVLVDRAGSVFLIRRTRAEADSWAGEDDEWLAPGEERAPGTTGYVPTLVGLLAVGAGVCALLGLSSLL